MPTISPNAESPNNRCQGHSRYQLSGPGWLACVPSTRNRPTSPVVGLSDVATSRTSSSIIAWSSKGYQRGCHWTTIITMNGTASTTTAAAATTVHRRARSTGTAFDGSIGHRTLMNRRRQTAAVDRDRALP